MERLQGGLDHGAKRFQDGVVRAAGPWSTSVHDLLRFLDGKGLGTPRPLSLVDGLETLTYVEGVTCGTRRPWPSWVHSDAALRQVGQWLRRYHDTVGDYRPPPDAAWRESHGHQDDDLLICHNDAAPYNAVWKNDRLVTFIDWDMAGPRLRTDDVCWVALSWVPLHERDLVSDEGFHDFHRRADRLRLFLGAYADRAFTPSGVLLRLETLLARQIDLIHRRARHDSTYRRMIDHGVTD